MPSGSPDAAAHPTPSLRRITGASGQRARSAGCLRVASRKDTADIRLIINLPKKPCFRVSPELGTHLKLPRLRGEISAPLSVKSSAEASTFLRRKLRRQRLPLPLFINSRQRFVSSLLGLFPDPSHQARRVPRRRARSYYPPFLSPEASL